MNTPQGHSGRSTRWWLLLVLLLAGSAMAEEAVHEYRLDNGMKILVKPDHRAPVVTSQVWYRVGSSYEHNGITGISHVVEHMMFKGTEKHPPGAFSEIVAANGGDENAFTSRDYTAYYETLAADRLEVALALEADRMHALLMDAEQAAREIRVVQEERRMRTDDDPQALTRERFRASAFLSSPYRWPIIGWMSDLERLDRETLVDWYERYYAPDNATLVVVGDVEPARVRELAEKHFGPVPPSGIEHRPPRREVEQNGERRITVKAPAELPYLMMGYKVPSLITAGDPADAYALEVLAGILDAGDSARLSRELVRGSQVAAGASAGYGLVSRLGTLLTLTATPAEGVDVGELESALRDQVERLREQPVTAEELERVKAQVMAADVYERDSIFYQAMELGILETVGLGHDALDDYVERIEAVTAEQVRDVARRYLDDDRLTVAILDPQPIEGGASARPAKKGGHHVR